MPYPTPTVKMQEDAQCIDCTKGFYGQMDTCTVSYEL